MTQESLYLLGIARAVVRSFTELPALRAAMVTGSVALGESDCYSDIDMALYYASLPSDDVLDQQRIVNNGSERIWTLGNRSDEVIIEAYDIRGVQCQIIHSTLQAQERIVDEVFVQQDTGSPTHKVLTGILDCMPLYGDDIIIAWQRRIREYPDALARAVVEKHLAFFPVWYMQFYLAPRDASLWIVQSIVDAAHNILAVLAGINRLYYSAFQFKRMKKFISKLSVRPERLYERIELALYAPLPEAAGVLESLVQDVVSLVEHYMPEVDTSTVRRRLGGRSKPWTMS